jgi:pantetheine-phosphate adenylyltransferase
MEKIAVFPGSFDPITRGHDSVIRRALPLFDKIILAIGDNPDKKPWFLLEKRISWMELLYKDVPQIKVIVYSGLTVDFCKKNNAKYILRGLRTSADFEFERTIGLMNKALYEEIETIFLLCDPAYAALSSSIVRDILKNGGDVTNFVPEGINLRG